MSDFYTAADILLNERVLLIKGEEHTISEVEMYKYKPVEHPDPYVHCHPDQLSRGFFYWHKASLKENAKFRGGTFKGVDLTLGEKDMYCGVLIRSITSSKGKLITGPCNVVNYILSAYKVESIADLVGEESLSFLENRHNLVLLTTEHRGNTLYAGPRIGLGDKDPTWRDKKYRFTSVKKGLKLNTQLEVVTE